ncbi:hypothetical protein NDU88_005208 [Pleurodeles waltl]|uniref:Uncharacterized protein n=1 Tax=Pleurodeles waltl TaxID=8319 RepID=A0AAV7WB79_PLEWA|nr:hypothetical protein NDU88_005208 [Pleurodeles waltl]
MTNAQAAQKDYSIKDMFAKLVGKKAERTQKEGQATATPEATLEVDEQVTRVFFERLFTTLRDNIAIFKEELAADVKDIRHNMSDLEQRVDSPERVHDNRDEEMEEHWSEILSLSGKTADLNYQLEGLENRSRWCNICIKGIPLQANAGRLKDYVHSCFATWPQIWRNKKLF